MPKGVYRKSPEHVAKLQQLAQERFLRNPSWAENRKGCTLTQEHKEKIGKAGIGREKSSATREKLSKALTGRTFSEGTLRKMSEAATERYKTHEPNRPWLGKKNPWITGSKNPAWKGGITPIMVVIRGTPEYKQWRRAVLGRDKYTCVWCGAVSGAWDHVQNRKIRVHADHIKEFSQFPELRFVLSNGRTLCSVCHHKRHGHSVPNGDTAPFQAVLGISVDDEVKVAETLS